MVHVVPCSIGLSMGGELRRRRRWPWPQRLGQGCPRHLSWRGCCQIDINLKPPQVERCCGDQNPIKKYLRGK